MVAYLKKPEGNEGFHQIVDFLNASHIRYALTENPTIYVSYIKLFWQTATARTLDNGEIELTATIDCTIKTVTKASVKRPLQLAVADGISSLPTTKIFEQLSLMGAQFFQGEGSTHPVESHHIPTSVPSTLQSPVSSTSRRTTKQESVVPQPRSPTQTPLPDETIHEERGDSVERADTTATSLDAEVNTHGSREDSMTQQELMVFYTTLSKNVESLETNLKQTNQIYGATYTRLIKKVKKLEKTGRYGHDMEFDFDFDAAKEVSTAGATVTTTSVAVSTAIPTRNTRVSTADDITMAETLVYIRRSASKDKGKDCKLKLRKKRGKGLPGYIKQLALLMLKNGKTYKLEFKVMKS
ncbi:hypothetical protein Tco_0672179 [Tanacetum coccineum]